MRYAINAEGNKVEAYPNLSALCPGCKAALIPKCGELKIWHWSHTAKDCDPWYEPETAWHLWWKNQFFRDNQEVVIGQHRADILAPSNLVIELQHSSISAAEIHEREDFYGRMIWIVDAHPFLANISFSYTKKRKIRMHWKWPRKTWMTARRRVFFDTRSGYLYRIDWVSPNQEVILVTEGTIENFIRGQQMQPNWSNFARAVDQQCPDCMRTCTRSSSNGYPTYWHCRLCGCTQDEQE